MNARRDRRRGAARRTRAKVASAASVAIAIAGAFAVSVDRPSRVLLTQAVEAAPPLPERLSETGLYREDGSIDPRNRYFSPQYPLWTDGAAKSRWIRLPEGTKIDVSDIDAWKFPEGTTLWKEFSWNGRKVETRMIRAEAGGEWTFATYVWREDQKDALLAPVDGVPAAFEVAPGKRHTIPSITDCNACHRSGASVVLGFNALQLSDDRDPLAPHAEVLKEGAMTLRTLVEEHRLAPARADLVQDPPRIREDDPVSRAAMGYLSANCGACHNTRGPLARLGISLLHEVGKESQEFEPARATTFGTKGRYVVPGVDEEVSRIVAPGQPGQSAVVHRMKSRRPASQMPPLGTVVVDEQALELVKRWIESGGAAPLP